MLGTLFVDCLGARRHYIWYRVRLAESTCSGFLVFPDRIRVSILIPEGPEECEWLLASYYAGDAAADPAFEAERKRSFAGSELARLEDDRVCEAVQSARRSPAFNRRFYSPFWESLLYSFNRMVLDDLERGGDRETS